MNLLAYFNKIKQDFGALPLSRRLTLAGVALMILVSILTFVYVTNQDEYRVLFSNLSSEDAASIVAKLKEKKIPYQLSPSSDTISVPSTKVSELRLEMAASGLLHGGGVGFEIFDNKVLGATEFEQQLNYRRALQGELARTINSLDEIQQSRVHIALPKESLFISQQKNPTASVTVKLKAGKKLKQSQIDGIGRLVASSVEGLNADDVIIVDSQGNVLSKNQGDSRLARMSSTQIEYQRNIERDLGNQIQSMLENVVGRNKAVVRVNADLDFRITEKTEEIYDPESPVVRSSQKQVDKSVGATPTAGRDAANIAARGAEKEKTDETTNYEINKTVSKTVMPVGEIKKISIAVLVDGIYVKNDKGVMAYQERAKKEIESLEDLVRKSTGFNAQRGDQVVVTSMPFDRTELDQGMVGQSWQDKIMAAMPIIKYGVALVGLLLLFLFVVRPLIRHTVAQPQRSGEITPAELTLPDEDGVSVELSGKSQPQLSMSPFGDRSLSEIDMVKQMAGADSRKFAELLRNWLK
ncbi:MAG: flagellar M-ring protein FliF [Deltaproteobacteria bacterium]|nr:flagellar M-ring protein FliF [Deltaproteobacteria bacterium]